MYESVARAARALGIRACFGIPGSGASLQLVTALVEAGIPFHRTYFEGSAAVMAATMGHLAGAPGLSLSIKGPGLANALPGLALAWFEELPLIHVAESAPDDAPPWVAHKRLNQDRLTAEVVKGSGRLAGEADHLRAAVAIAVAGASARVEGGGDAGAGAPVGVPGPVLLEMGAGDPPAPRGGGADFSAVPIPVDAAALGRAEAILRGAEKPIVVAGAYAIRAGLGPWLARLRVPVFTTVAAKGVLDETTPYSAGIYTGVDGERTPESRLRAVRDAVVSVGCTAKELLRVQPWGAPSVHLGAMAGPDLAGFAFDALLPAARWTDLEGFLAGHAWGTSEIESAKQALRKQLVEGFLPGAIYAALAERFGTEARVVLDTGSFCTIGEHAWRSTAPDQLLLSARGRYMGSALPMAIGAALQDRGRPTVAVAGDGGIGMYLAEIQLAVAERLPLLVILMTDGAYGSIRRPAAPKGLNLEVLRVPADRWRGALEGFGVPGARATSEGAVREALAAWSPEAGPFFLEIPFEPDAYDAMVEGIRG